ncbi:hypothetical protein OS242_07695 [Tumebacillus sp. DT12]|uniref:Uncharacterized protein n=1 Tax=Tumebacillus lacus TaxID=2995335 RepID=A0ABT3WYV1_9BACL|nr:hypothetical protein [Tumebacillus lacus]MCX7569844.1 hypothetical protein [Tumebacillus lacus]
MASINPETQDTLQTQHTMRERARQLKGEIVIGRLTAVSQTTLRVRTYGSVGRLFLVIPVRLRNVQDLFTHPSA